MEAQAHPEKAAASHDVRARLRASLARRAPVLATTDACRLVDDAADGFPGVVVDGYGGWAVLSVLDAAAEPIAPPLAEALLAEGQRGVYLKRRPRADLRRAEHATLAPERPFAGEAAPAALVVHEGDLRVRVTLADGLSTGLFTDQRDNRRLVRELSRDASVLNLFAYTCSFTVAAALGGARSTTSVDLSKRALSRGADNLTLNSVAGPRHRLLPADALKFLERAGRRDERFDVIVLDPPSFGTRARGTFSVERDHEALIAGCVGVLATGGRLLAVTNHRGTSAPRLLSTVRDAARRAGREIQALTELPLPPDHRHLPGGAAATKSCLLTTG